MNYFITEIGNIGANAANNVGTPFYRASDGKFVLIGSRTTYASGVSVQNLTLHEFSSSGIEEKKKLFGSTVVSHPFAAIGDSAGSIYTWSLDTVTNLYPCVYKFSNAYVKLAGARNAYSGTANHQYVAMPSIDISESLGYVFVASTNRASSIQGGMAALSTTDLSRQWQVLYPTTTYAQNCSLSGSYVYFILTESSYPILVKLSASTGAQQWATKIDRTIGISAPTYVGLKADASGNCYVAVSEGTGFYAIAKFNSSGSMTWHKRFTQTLTSTGNPVGFQIDASGNSYLMVQYSNQSLGRMVLGIFKVDTDGNLVYARDLVRYNVTGLSGYGYSSLGITPDGIICCDVTTTNSTDGNGMLFAHLPQDGSMTGTYNERVSFLVSSELSATTASVPTTSTYSGSQTSGTTWASYATGTVYNNYEAFGVS